MKRCYRLLGRLLLLIAILGLAAAVAAPLAFAAEPLWDETVVTTNVEDQTEPAVDAGRIVWVDYRNWDPDMYEYTLNDLYMYDLESLVESRLPTALDPWGHPEPSWNAPPATDGDYVVWAGGHLSDDGVGSAVYIYLLNMRTGMQRRLTSDAWRPAISGTTAVWSADADIYSRNLVSGVGRRITSSPWDQLSPNISGNRVVWQDNRNGHWDIYLYDLSTNATRRLTDEPEAQKAPDVSGTRVVWQDARNGQLDIYLRDLATGVESRLTTDSSNQYDPHIAGPLVAWTDRRDGGERIYIYDILSGIESRLSVADSWQRNPDIHGSNVVWEDDRAGNWDIFLAKLRAPVLTSSAASTVAYNATATVSAVLMAFGASEPLGGVDVRIEMSTDLAKWSTVATRTTDASGHVEVASPALQTRTYFRAVCPGNAERLSAEGSPVKVMPRTYLTAPTAARTGIRSYRVSGYLKPRHAAGAKVVRIYAQYRQGGSWVNKGYFYATAENFYSYSRYRTVHTFPKSGSWRLRAYHADSSHAPTWSAYKYLSVH